MAEGFWLSEAQFARLEPLLPSDTRGVARVDDRRVISGIVHVLMSGARWSDAPSIYGPRKTLYNRLRAYESGADLAKPPPGDVQAPPATPSPERPPRTPAT